jgi:hypothetical protein
MERVNAFSLLWACRKLTTENTEGPPSIKKISPDLAIGAGDQNRSIRQRMPVWTGEFSESVQVGLSGFPGQANNSQPESMWLNLNTRLAL